MASEEAKEYHIKKKLQDTRRGSYVDDDEVKEEEDEAVKSLTLKGTEEGGCGERERGREWVCVCVWEEGGWGGCGCWWNVLCVAHSQ